MIYFESPRSNLRKIDTFARSFSKIQWCECLLDFVSIMTCSHSRSFNKPDLHWDSVNLMLLWRVTSVLLMDGGQLQTTTLLVKIAWDSDFEIFLELLWCFDDGWGLLMMTKFVFSVVDAFIGNYLAEIPLAESA